MYQGVRLLNFKAKNAYSGEMAENLGPSRENKEEDSIKNTMQHVGNSELENDEFEVDAAPPQVNSVTIHVEARVATTIESEQA